MSVRHYTVAVGSWPLMEAGLLLALSGSDDSPLAEDYEEARRLAVVLRVESEVFTELSRLLTEKPSPLTPVVRVRLASWERMRSRLLEGVVTLEGSEAQAAVLLGMSRIELGVLRRQLGRFDLGGE